MNAVFFFFFWAGGVGAKYIHTTDAYSLFCEGYAIQVPFWHLNAAAAAKVTLIICNSKFLECVGRSILINSILKGLLRLHIYFQFFFWGRSVCVCVCE